MNQWLEVNCFKCKSPNLINNGDTEDFTVEDMTGFKCYNCNSNNAFDEFGEAFESEEDQFDEGFKLPARNDSRLNKIPKSLRSLDWVDCSVKFQWFTDNQIMPVLLAVRRKNEKNDWTYEILYGIIRWERATYSFVFSIEGKEDLPWPIENSCFYHIIRNV